MSEHLKALAVCSKITLMTKIIYKEEEKVFLIVQKRI